MFDLSGKKVLVTGSTQGIGKEVAKLLGASGANVIIHGATSLEKCRKAAMEVPGNAELVVENLSLPGAAERLYQKTGDVDILILNASIQIKKNWREITSEEIDLQMTTNFKSSFQLIQNYVPYMLAKGWGRIITVGSVQQSKPHKDMAIYAASKCAQMSLVKNLGAQFAPFGVTVNNISPGVIATPRNKEALNDLEYSKKVFEKIPCGFAGMPTDCAGAFLLLCSEQGRYIVGSDLMIDGGMHL